MPESKSGALTNLATPQRKTCEFVLWRKSAPTAHPTAHPNAASGCRASVRATKPRCPARAPRPPRAPPVPTQMPRTRNLPIPSCARDANARRVPRAQWRRRESAQARRVEGRSGHNPRKRFLFSPTACFVSIPAQRKSTRSRSRSAARRARSSSAAASPAPARSPMPRAIAGCGCRKNGTSAPRRGRCPRDRARGRRVSQRRLRPSSTDAASELPPPRPPPSGMRLMTRDVGARAASAVASCSARAARTTRSSSGATPGRSGVRRIAPSSRAVERDRVGEIDRDEQRLQRVIAVGAPSGDVQKQIDLRRGGHRDRRHAAIVAAPAPRRASKPRFRTSPSGRRRFALRCRRG